MTANAQAGRAATGWRFEHRPHADLPPLAWVARVGGDRVEVDCGTSVRLADEGFIEGSWAGGPALADAARAADVVASGMVATDDGLILVTPSHTLDGVFLVAERGALVASNTLVGLLEATGLELRDDVLYPPLFGRINAGVSRAIDELPTSGPPITQVYWHNLSLAADGSWRVAPKQREPGFGSYAEYRDRIVAATSSILRNAAGYEPIVSLSSGYDSTAAAVVGAAAGMRRAASLRDAVAWRGYAGTHDSGAAAAAAVGLELAEFDRLAYLRDAAELPEAEFLANGMSGEDIVLRSIEPALHRTVLLSGFWGGAAWRGFDRSELRRTDLSGASLLEFRLRVDFIHLPVPYIGGIHQPDLARIRRSAEMKPYSVGGEYDEPVPRRLAEDAGVPRGSFATTKLAASRRLHIEGIDGLSPAARADFEAFAGADAIAALPRAKPFGRRHRLAIRVARALRLPGLVAGLEERRRQRVHLEPVLGSLLLRWAVARVRPRYAALRASRNAAKASDITP